MSMEMVSNKGIYSPEGNRKAVIIGAASTVLLTAFFLFLPFLIPLEQLKSTYFELTGNWMFGNPFSRFRFVGGPIAGFLTAYLTNGRWNNRVTNAIKAVIYGLAALYCLVVGYYLFQSIFVWNTYPLYQIIVLPIISGLPVAFITFFGGLVGGLLGHGLHAFRRIHSSTGG